MGQDTWGKIQASAHALDGVVGEALNKKDEPQSN